MSKRSRSIIEPHPLFDESWYLAQVSETLAESALAHYRRVGATQGLSPHPLFEATWYLAQLEQPLPEGENPLEHYLTIGAARGLSPHPLFDAPWYHQQQLLTQRPASKHGGPSAERRSEDSHTKANAPRKHAKRGAKRALMGHWSLVSAGRVQQALPLSTGQRVTLESLQRKGRKLARNPEAFFADSRSPLVRVLGKLLVKRQGSSGAKR